MNLLFFDQSLHIQNANVSGYYKIQILSKNNKIQGVPEKKMYTYFEWL